MRCDATPILSSISPRKCRIRPCAAVNAPLTPAYWICGSATNKKTTENDQECTAGAYRDLSSSCTCTGQAAASPNAQMVCPSICFVISHSLPARHATQRQQTTPLDTCQKHEGQASLVAKHQVHVRLQQHNQHLGRFRSRKPLTCRSPLAARRPSACAS